MNDTHSGFLCRFLFGEIWNEILAKYYEEPNFFFRHSNCVLLNDLLGSPLMNIYGSDHGPSAVVYHALRNFLNSAPTSSLNLSAYKCARRLRHISFERWDVEP